MYVESWGTSPVRRNFVLGGVWRIGRIQKKRDFRETGPGESRKETDGIDSRNGWESGVSNRQGPGAS